MSNVEVPNTAQVFIDKPNEGVVFFTVSELPVARVFPDLLPKVVRGNWLAGEASKEMLNRWRDLGAVTVEETDPFVQMLSRHFEDDSPKTAQVAVGMLVSNGLLRDEDGFLVPERQFLSCVSSQKDQMDFYDASIHFNEKH
jgi:hypothetical protein